MKYSVKNNTFKVALLGQPNTGKTTLFNALTGSHQHVGNWPGKTVEMKSGEMKRDLSIELIDLPGSYSLLAVSDEECVTRDFICSGKTDLAVVIIDASQFERSMYLLSDFSGLKIPCIAVLNMSDIAKEKGIHVSPEILSGFLGIPVIESVAVKKNGTIELEKAILNARTSEHFLGTDIFKSIEGGFSSFRNYISDKLTSADTAICSSEWIALKVMEGDEDIITKITSSSDKISRSEITALINEASGNLSGACSKGCVACSPSLALFVAGVKFSWIQKIAQKAVRRSDNKKVHFSLFDKIATHTVLGKPIAFFSLILAFAVSMILTLPVMLGMFKLLLPVYSAFKSGMSAFSFPQFIISLVTEALIPASFMAIIMGFFILGTSCVFAFMEDIGYMARIAYVFDGFMNRIGLHGKAVMPFVVSLGCNMGGVTSSRVLDSWQQRLLSIAVSWVIPCNAIWGVTAFFGALFFGINTVWVLLALFAVMLFHMKITSLLFGKLIPEIDKSGIVMELPPYHKPNWRTIFRAVWIRMKGVVTKAFSIVIFISVIMWLLSYTADGNFHNSILFKVGSFLEPVSSLFGLSWELFTAFLVSAMGKESALGVIAMLFNAGDGLTSFTGMMVSGAYSYSHEVLGTRLITSVTKPQALAFMFAFFFNVPCMAAVASTRIELNSVKWTLAIFIYYLTSALFLGGAAYRLGYLIF